ncbi:THAP domain-containing protein 3 isoform X2 [Ochotona princeps]|uniref:THAP domain-containing protein 3 isoform X2 n=1 Tax=Ochotona princeps TaxID=9978 RepID=UPI0027145892|nr:THAP domain-containing protein 3 isoform X2 [Ochotona princeps]
MPKSCAARQCCNRYGNRRKQLTFHRFPFSRPELLKEWVLNIGRADFKPKKHTVICSEHFRPECFSAFGNRKNLKHNAVPTVFAFQDPSQLVREDTDLAGTGDAAQQREVPEAEAGEPGTGRSTDTVMEERQLVPHAGGPLEPVWPQKVEVAEGPSQVAGPLGPRGPLPRQPSDHSYALLDLGALKKKLFLTLKENEKLRKRLKAQRLLLHRLSSRLRAHREGLPGPQTAAQPELHD